MRLSRYLPLFLPVGSILAASSTSGPAYVGGIAPILNAHCVECHRAGEAAPMAFTSYQEVRPWAKAIREAVTRRVMPPWFAAPNPDHAFRNDRTLTADEIDLIGKWVANGAPEGIAAGAVSAPPPPMAMVDGWNIGKPDLIFDFGQEFEIPATGVVAYQYFTVPTNFTEDRWVEAAEIRPQNRAATHHINVFLLEPGANGKSDSRPFLVGYAPGVQPLRLDPGSAMLIKAGTRLLFQAHYTPNGKPAKDRSFIGLRLASAPVTQRSITEGASNNTFRIPPRDGNYEVRSEWTAKYDVDLFAMMPHMHLRGKDFRYTIHYPDGRLDRVLDVPRYDFNWQLGYELKTPLHLPKGTRIECVAHFDNSANNRFNPDPAMEVRWGDQTFEEMMIGFFLYKIPVAAQPRQQTAAAR